MLRSLTIENFKAFGARQEIPLAPITLIFGANSSGKSSLLQTLLLLKQTLEEAEHPETTLLPKGKLVDLGSFKELIYKHDTTKSLTIALEVSPEARDQSSGRRTRFPDWTKDGFQLSFAFRHFTRFGVQVDQMNLSRGPADPVILALERRVPSPDHKRASRARRVGPGPQTIMSVADVAQDPTLFAADFDRSEPERKRALRGIERRIKSLRGIRDAASHVEGSKQGAQRADYSRYADLFGEYIGGAQRSVGEDLKTVDSELKRLETEQQRLSNYTLDEFVRAQDESHKKHVIAVANFLPVRVPRGAIAGHSEGGAELDWQYVSYYAYGSIGAYEQSPRFLPRLFTAGAVLRRLLDGLVYLGPLREYPERHYIFSGNLVEEVGKSGKGMPDLLFQDRKLVRRVNEWMEQFGLEHEIRVKTVRDPDVEDVYTLRLADRESGVTVSPLDVGFGISQMLPIVVQSLLAEDRVICVEQPEIHLHPRLQAEFGSLLADVVSGAHPNQFLIETHSEHLILRLQRLIRKKKLDCDNVKVLHVGKSEGGAVVREMRLDQDGRFLEQWPEGFFEEGFTERFED